MNTYPKDVQSKSVQVCMDDLLLSSTPVKRKRLLLGDAPPHLPVLPSPEVSPVHRCQRGSSYRGMQWQSEEAAGQHTPPPVLLFQPSEDELQKQSAPDDTGSGYQEESTLALDDTGNHHSKNDQSKPFHRLA